MRSLFIVMALGLLSFAVNAQNATFAMPDPSADNSAKAPVKDHYLGSFECPKQKVKIVASATGEDPAKVEQFIQAWGGDEELSYEEDVEENTTIEMYKGYIIAGVFGSAEQEYIKVANNKYKHSQSDNETEEDEDFGKVYSKKGTVFVSIMPSSKTDGSYAVKTDIVINMDTEKYGKVVMKMSNKMDQCKFTRAN